MRVCPEIQLPTPPIGYVGVELGRGEVGVAEHLLDGAQIGAALQQMGGERMAEQVRMDAVRVEPGFLGELAEDQEGAGAGEGAAAGVQEELGPVAAVEVRPAAREVAPQGLGGVPADGNDALLAPLPITRTSLSSRSTPALSRPIASETRSPAP